MVGRLRGTLLGGQETGLLEGREVEFTSKNISDQYTKVPAINLVAIIIKSLTLLGEHHH
jgi:hypothetical protein